MLRLQNRISEFYNTWNTVCSAIQDLPFVTIGLLTIMLKLWVNICCCWLDILFQPRLFMCATRIGLGLMINTSMLWASSTTLKFGGPVIALRLTAKSLFAVKWKLMKPTLKPSVSLVSETGMFLWKKKKKRKNVYSN